MGLVPGKTFAGAWRVEMNGGRFRQDASALLTLRSKNISSTSAVPSVTELFVQGPRGVTLVGTFPTGEAFGLPDFAQRLNLEKSDRRLTYVAYTATKTAYERTCTEQGGDTLLGYCSFRNKVLPAKLNTQSLSMNAWTWNIGNVAGTCSSYKFKVCYQGTERRISDQILSFEQTYGKPGVLFLQEQWHGDCNGAGLSTTWYFWNPQLCDNPTRGTPSWIRILGNRYAVRCTSTNYAGGLTNGFECVAINSALFYFINDTYLGAPSGYHTPCSADTGFQVVRVASVASNVPLILANTHLTGADNPACRAEQIRTLATDLRNLNYPRVLFAGDFNTEPYNDGTSGAISFRTNFVTASGGAVSPVATMIDPGNLASAGYFYGNVALDHVLSNTFTGSCAVSPAFDGTDHRLMRCSLQSPAY